jgi:hypothetical protein
MALTAPVPNLVTTVPLFSAAAPVWSRRINGIVAGQPTAANSTGAATLYGVWHPGTQNAARVFRFVGDGSTVAFTLPTAATGVTYPTTVAASLTVINYLEAIALTFAPQYALNAVVRQRMGSDGTPTGTQWKINGTTVTFGTAPVAGQTVEILIPDTATISQLPGAALTANTQALITPRDFSTAGVAAVVLSTVGSR